MPEGKFSVGTIGVGAVGTVLSACLAKAGARVVIADLPERIAQVKANGLQVRGVGMEIDCHRDAVVAVDSISDMASMDLDCLVVGTKAYVLKRIMPAVAEVAGDDCLVISAENGIGTEDEIAHYVPERNAARMVVNYAGNIDDDGIAQLIWFNPPNYFGSLRNGRDARLVTVTELLSASGLTSEMVDPATIRQRAFLKTILTSALMPLCAVMGFTMKEAMSGKATRQMAGELLREGLAVAARLGYDYGPDIWEKCMGYLDKGGDHHPSMSVDLWHKRPTEIEFINCKILELGREYADLELAANRVLTCLLMTHEVRNGTRDPQDFPDFVLCAKE